jgi:hypothetical protein
VKLETDKRRQTTPKFRKAEKQFSVEYAFQDPANLFLYLYLCTSVYIYVSCAFACQGLSFLSPKTSSLQFAQLTFLRRDGEDIEETDPKDGCRPLHAAVITEQEDAVRYLLRKLCLRKSGVRQ